MKITFAGDLLLKRYETYIGNDAVDYAFADLKSVLSKSDFRMLNLETVYNNGTFLPITKSGPANFSMPEYVYALKSMNMDVVGLANNHTGDFGEECALYTMDLLDQNGIKYIGAGKNIEEAYKPYIFQKDGKTVSVLAICENEFGIADTNCVGAAGFSLGMATRKIREEKEENDYVVVFFHGGNEENPIPSPGKQELYRFFIDTGADAVIAMHTHCPQGYEIYKEKPIVYSMGNFFYPKPDETEDKIKTSTARYGYMSTLTFEESKVGLKIHPYHFNNEAITLLKGKQLEKFNEYMAKICEPINNAQLLRRYFEGWCLIGGRVYVQFADWDEEMRTDKEKIRHLLNNYTCEAHYEVVREYLKLCYNGREAEAEEYKNKIEILKVINVFE